MPDQNTSMSKRTSPKKAAHGNAAKTLIESQKHSNCCDGNPIHPDHAVILPRLSKIKGQIEGIERMIGNRRYCVDVLVQFRAAIAALRTAEISIFETHLRHCVQSAMKSHDEKEIEKKIHELTKLLSRRSVI